MRAKITKGFFIITIVLGVYTPLFSQWDEDFSDNEFTSNPEWVGNDSDFIIEGEILRLSSAPVTNSSYLTTHSDISLEATWSFSLKLDFNPSSSNYTKVYLIADNEDLNNVQNGYFVKIGGTPDEISLYKVIGGQESLIIDGLDGRVSLSSVEVSILVTRDINHVWDLKSKLIGESDFLSEGTIINAEIQSSSFFGFYCKYTSTRSTKFYFDDISVNGTPYVDKDPPSLLSATTQTPFKVLLGFNEALDTTEAKTISHYKLNDSVPPINVTPITTDTLLLEFVNKIELVNTLKLIAIPDLMGNSLDTILHVVYVDPAPYVHRDLVINEIFPDPNPQEDLPAFEFVELFNNSNRIIDLNNWKFTDGTKVATFKSHLIYPDSFLIICSDESSIEFQTYGTTIGLTSWPSLNNGGDPLLLTDGFGNIIDSLTYSLDWYKDLSKDDGGWSLEQINPTIVSSGEENWSASIEVGGGTPGLVNSVFDLGIDENSPILISIKTPSRNEIKLAFSEQIDSLISINSNTYSLNETINPDYIEQISLDTILLKFNSDLSLTNTLSIHGLTDVNGNLLDTLVQVFFISPLPSRFRDVVINEIFVDPNPQEDLPLFEFIELLNISDRIIDLEGWQFSDGSKTATFTSHLLFPDSFLIVCSEKAKDSYQTWGATLGINNFPSLNNNGDSLKLISSTELIIDSLIYGTSWYKNSNKDDGGWSLEQLNPLSKCLGIYNWNSSKSLTGGTPGKANSIYSVNTDFEPPQITLALLTDSLLEVWLSEPALPNTIIGTINPDDLSAEFNINNPSSFISTYINKGLNNNTTYLIEIPLEDCNGNIETISSDIIQIANPTLKSIVINELLFNPYANGADFVEILNTTKNTYNLKNYVLSNQDVDIVISDTTLLLKPNSYVALSENIVFLKNEYLAPDSSLIETNLPSMPNEEGVVMLKSNQNKTLDSVYYSDNYHFSLIADTEGISLERISTLEDSNNNNNWKSAAETVGFATPGYENSQSRVIVSAGSISVSPEVLTPNNDGQADYCQIDFNLTQQAMTVSINVYTLGGHLVKAVANNSIISPNGFFTWDGTNQQGGMLPTAHYIIISEVITSDGKTLHFRNKIVVANGF